MEWIEIEGMYLHNMGRQDRKSCDELNTSTAVWAAAH